MTEDIGPLLKHWPYDPKNSIRKIFSSKGVEKIQVRIDQGPFQGILQMELDGRPDGRKPHNSAFALDHFTDRLHHFIEEHGTSDGFSLKKSHCSELFDESRLLYERYVFLLQIRDYDRVIRDTQRNMELFRFVNQYAATEKDRLNLEKWWPYVLRIHAIARVMIASQENDFTKGIQIIRDVLDKIENLQEVDAEEFGIEKKRSVESLNELLNELEQQRPLTESERLQKELLEAIDNEEFERAAELRDRINTIGEKDG
ncbi:MAG: UvrB/UvrC motif-containing protein [Gemmatimonadetes bacterium]|nr:UvrB/UvrC motif-containing protein [Gemmatimonadota bacterium]